MSALSSLRLRFRRAVERGDPRLGLIVGSAIALGVAVWFAARAPYAQRLDNIVLDLSFRLRPRIRESERILNIDIDDATKRELGEIDRRHEAQVLTALTRLGAGQVVYDVEFQASAPRRGEFDEETGELALPDKGLEFRAAVARAGNVTLGYHFDLQDAAADLLARRPSLKEALSRDLALGAEELAARSGVPVAEFGDILELLRSRAGVDLALERLGSKPDLTFADLRRSLLPRYDPKEDAGVLRLVQHAYGVARATSRLEGSYPPLRLEAPLARPAEGRGITPPVLPFMDRIVGGGATNAESDADGVLRRPWAFLTWKGRPHFYLGFVAGVRGLTGSGERAEVVLKPGRIVIEVLRGAERRASVEIPVDEEGRILVNWAGNSSARRDWFTHLPFVHLLGFFEERYLKLDENTRAILGQLDEDERREIGAAAYLAGSDRLRELLRGAAEKVPGEAAGIERALDGFRGRIMETMARDVAEADAAIPRLRAEGKDQLARRTKEARDRRQAELEGFRAPYDRERELRRRVEGRICLVGAAYTGSGDLHSTSLGRSTPGVDVHANVVNMILTGQAIRRGAAWIDFAYLSVLGLLVSAAVSYGNTKTSILAAAGAAGAAMAVYWLLFTGPAVLISGAGPFFSAGLALLGTIAFKELVTQRSKRKLQRELEKNTSPELVRILMEHPEFISRPRKMAGTFLFSDVKAFTSISEKMSADVLFPFINRYLDRMTQALKRHQAFVDKYIGDGIMALFGVPVASADHARNACLAALDCQAAVRELNAEFAREGLPQIQVRIGIHSGDVNAGSVGAVDRSNYTVLGDAVNLASRLEGANKEYGSSIMISEATWGLVGGQFAARELDRIRVVGKRNAVRIFELLAPSGGPLPFAPGFLAEYEQALKAFRERRWEEAIAGFGRALALNPGDRPSENYVERARAFRVDPPPPDWEGVFDLHSK